MTGMILIIEDESVLARNVKTYLERKGYEAITASTVREGLVKYSEFQPDAILVDYNLPDSTGTELIRQIRNEDRATKLVVITAHGSIDVAVETMKAGADDYLTKPISLDELTLLLDRLLSQARLEQTLSYYQSREERRSGLDRIRGTSRPIFELKERIARVLAADEKAAHERQPGPPVLILGQTGTGKELVARALHYDGPRRTKPFIEVNCAALPEQLVESELFGHERGAFTGAKDKSKGLFQAADGGTLFLDEIGEMPMPLQAKLLKAIEDRVVRPVGSARDHRIDVRILAASNVAIDERVKTNEFRADLLYRLNTVTIVTPPLRQRGHDILELAEEFKAEFEKRYGRRTLSFDEDSRRAMLDYYWPGNVRELRNVVEQSVLLCVGDVIRGSELNLREPRLVTESSLGDGEKCDTLAAAELDLIKSALKRHSGSVSMAARTLGVSRDTLRYRMDRLSINRDEFR